MKNEHVVWAYAELQDGSGQLVLCGVTDRGIEYMRDTPGQSLVINPPGNGFANVKQILVFYEKDKATLKATLAKAGVVVSEVH